MSVGTCPHGHPWDVQNTRYSADGSQCRKCRKCDAERKRAERRAGKTTSKEVMTRSVRKYRSSLRALIDKHKAAKGCQVCGEADPVVLDLHHRDPASKHPNLRNKGPRTGGTHLLGLGRDALLAEIAKCDVLCANCHRRETYRQHAAGKFRDPREDAATLFDNEGART